MGKGKIPGEMGSPGGPLSNFLSALITGGVVVGALALPVVAVTYMEPATFSWVLKSLLISSGCGAVLATLMLRSNAAPVAMLGTMTGALSGVGFFTAAMMGVGVGIKKVISYM